MMSLLIVIPLIVVLASYALTGWLIVKTPKKPGSEQTPRVARTRTRPMMGEFHQIMML